MPCQKWFWVWHRIFVFTSYYIPKYQEDYSREGRNVSLLMAGGLSDQVIKVTTGQAQDRTRILVIMFPSDSPVVQTASAGTAGSASS